MTGTAGGPLPRDADVEALRTDRYLDALLAAADSRALDAPVPASLDPAIRRAIRRLRRDLVRVHPSFRFEERLAARLAAAAAAIEAGTAGSDTTPSLAPVDLGWDPELDPAAAMRVPLGDLVRRREFLIGGAMASAAVSLAGAALVVARRRARRPVPAMTRAARAVRAGRRRAATTAGRRSGATRRAPLA